MRLTLRHLLGSHWLPAHWLTGHRLARHITWVEALLTWHWVHHTSWLVASHSISHLHLWEGIHLHLGSLVHLHLHL